MSGCPRGAARAVHARGGQLEPRRHETQVMRVQQMRAEPTAEGHGHEPPGEPRVFAGQHRAALAHLQPHAAERLAHQFDDVAGLQRVPINGESSVFWGHYAPSPVWTCRGHDALPVMPW
jgi:hypothetical protein